MAPVTSSFMPPQESEFFGTTIVQTVLQETVPKKKEPQWTPGTVYSLETGDFWCGTSRVSCTALSGRQTFENDERSNCAKGLSFAQTQPSPRAVRVFFPCSTCVCLQLHVDILLRDIKGSKGKLPRKACGGSWRVVSELKLFAD